MKSKKKKPAKKQRKPFEFFAVVSDRNHFFVGYHATPTRESSAPALEKAIEYSKDAPFGPKETFRVAKFREVIE